MCIAVFLYEQKLKTIFKHYENKKSFYNDIVFFFSSFFKGFQSPKVVSDLRFVEILQVRIQGTYLSWRASLLQLATFKC